MTSSLHLGGIHQRVADTIAVFIQQHNVGREMNNAVVDHDVVRVREALVLPRIQKQPIALQGNQDVEVLLCWNSPCYNYRFNHTPFPCTIIADGGDNDRRQTGSLTQVCIHM